MLACENLLMSFRNEEQLLNVIFRIGEAWSADNVTDELSKHAVCRQQGRGPYRRSCSEEAGSGFPRDLADAVLKAINENVRGIYDICGSEAITGAELYNRLAEKCRPKSKVAGDETARRSASLPKSTA